LAGPGFEDSIAEKQTAVKSEQQAKAPSSVAGRGPTDQGKKAPCMYWILTVSHSLQFILFFNDSSSTSFSYNIYIYTSFHHRINGVYIQVVSLQLLPLLLLLLMILSYCMRKSFSITISQEASDRLSAERRILGGMQLYLALITCMIHMHLI
jgi:hypothetical protein